MVGDPILLKHEDSRELRAVTIVESDGMNVNRRMDARQEQSPIDGCYFAENRNLKSQTYSF